MRKQIYPRAVLDLGHLRENVKMVTGRCAAMGIQVMGVVKGCDGLPRCASQFVRGGCSSLGSSRIGQLADLRAAGISLPLWLIRIPMLSDAEEVVQVADGSLNSDLAVLRALDQAARAQGKTHQVLLMTDLGDLREGFWGVKELTEAALMVERDCPGLHLTGIGTNLGCYGSVLATREKMEELCAQAKEVEAAIGRPLEVVSGGATSSYMRVLDGTMPEGVNQLRIGEGILMARDLPDLHGVDMGPMHRDAITLEAEVVEVREKPTYPQGEITVDAFGHRQAYEDRGIRCHAVLAVGKVDYGDPGELFPEASGVRVLGASSDHTLLDIQDALDQGQEIRVGDILRFRLTYAAAVYVTSSRDVGHYYVDQG